MTAPEPATHISSNLRDSLLAEARTALLDSMADAVRAMGFTMADVIDAVLAATGEGFDELAQLRNKHGFEMAKGLTASRISLVHEEDLEFSIRLSDLARNLRSLTEQDLSPLHMRFIRLLDQQDVSDEQTPVGPDAACAGLRALVDAADMMPDQRLNLLMRAEAPLGAALKSLYKKLNERFEAAGVASTMNLRQRQQGPREAASGGALQQLQQRLVGGSTNIPGSNIDGALDPNLGAALREQIMAWLIEQQAARAGRPAEGPLQGLGGSGIAALLSPAGRASLEALGRLFEALFADPDLTPTVKGLIGRLQIPVLRLALADDGVISRLDHPVHRLIDALGIAALDLPEKDEAKALHAIVDKLEKRSFADAATFTEAAAAVEAHTQSILAEIRTRVVDFVPTAQREEQREAHVRLASQALRVLCEPTVPAQISNFLQSYWIKVLLGALASRGERSDIWRNLLETAHQLVESGKPIELPEQREALTKMLPELVKRLDSGLALAGLDEAGRRTALQPCMSMHTALMRGQPMPTEEPLAPRPAIRWRGVPDAPGLRIARGPEYLTREPVSPAALANLAVGMSLTCMLPEMNLRGGPRGGTVAWVGPANRVLLWVTPGLNGCCLLPMRWIGDALGTGEAKLHVPEPLFERLASAALYR
ncbi:MAG TPA: DUF1631 family protein [Rhodocyclaceae bacterium]|nr:DUF1631 family protein [Rhodocyclaceae bacterium]